MTAFLLDTNVISEIAGTDRNPQVAAFLANLADGYVSVITIHELYFGLERLQPGRRRQSLTETVEQFVALYHDRVLAITEVEGRAAASLRANASREGRTLHLADALIAASARVHGLTIATRNITDFEGLGIPLHNPWQT